MSTQPSPGPASPTGGEAPPAATSPPWPSSPAEWITRGLAFRWLDFGVYQVERVLVVAAVLLMVTMLALEILYLSMVSDESRLAAFIIGWVERMGSNELGEASRARFELWLVRAEIVAFIGLCYAAVSTRLGARPLWAKALVTLCVLGGILSFAEVVRQYPSRVAYTVLLGFAATVSLVAWLATPRSAPSEHRRSRRAVFISIAAASPVLLWLFRDLPQDYSFAQHRSLFLLLWVGFLGASIATYQRAHLRIDFVRKLVEKTRARRPYNAVSLLVTAAFTLAFFYIAWDYVFNAETGARTTRSEQGAIPDWFKVLAIPVSLGIMFLRFTGQAIGEVLGVGAEKSADSPP